MRSTERPSAVAGFNLLELAIVLALFGSVLLIVMHYRPVRVNSGDVVARGYQDQIVAAIYQFAERHFRLPCADTDGDGIEGAGSLGCGTTDSQYVVGAVPFKTIGLSDPTALGPNMAQEYIYGVYRNTTAGADLVTVAERTGDAADDGGYRQLDDLRFALRGLDGNTVDATRVHVTGDGGAAGAADCASNRVANVAFFVIYGGALDADANGRLFDGANAPQTWPTGGSLCAAGPNTRSSEQYDDVVVAVGFAELLGVLSR